MLRLWNFFRGYVIINVNGFFIEKFINLCAIKGIYLWEIKRKKNNNMTLCISTRGFKQLRGIARKTKCKVKILRKVGFPFIKFRYRKRKSFVAGFVLFILLLYVLSSFIWVVEIEGSKNVSSQKIVDFLDTRGITPGVLKFNIDKDELIQTMLIEIGEISWTEISLSGTKIKVKIVERLPEQVSPDDKTPCNIYAEKNGVINSIIARNGSAMVREGDVVRYGDILISGIIDNKFHPENPRLVHSDGEVKAITWYQEKVDVNFVQIKRERQNEYKYGFGINFFSNFYNIFRNESPYKLYDLEEKQTRLHLWKDFELPIEFVTKKYYKVEYKKYVYSKDKVINEANELLTEKMSNSLPAGIEIIDKKIEYNNVYDNTIEAIATYKCIEEIGNKKKIIEE